MAGTDTDESFSIPPHSDHAFSHSQEDDGIMIVQERGNAQELDEAREAPSTWEFVRGRVAEAADVVRRPLRYFIGDGEGEGVSDALQAPVSITVPKWALVSIIGLSFVVLWEQERRIWACLKMSERHQAGLLRLAEAFVASSSRAQEVAETAAADRASMAVQQSRESGLLGAALGMGAALFLLSDQRLKRDITRLPGSIGGCPLYTWRWSADATARFGLRGSSRGVLAQEVGSLRPEAVHVGTDGYMRVDYAMLSLS